MANCQFTLLRLGFRCLGRTFLGLKDARRGWCGSFRHYRTRFWRANTTTTTQNWFSPALNHAHLLAAINSQPSTLIFKSNIKPRTSNIAASAALLLPSTFFALPLRFLFLNSYFILPTFLPFCYFPRSHAVTDFGRTILSHLHNPRLRPNPRSATCSERKTP